MLYEQKSGTRGVAECVTDVLTTFWRLLWSVTESDARQHGIYLFYIITKSLFYYKAKAGLLPRLCHAFARKKAIWLIWRDLWFIQNEAISLVAVCSKELWLVEKNRATVKPDSSDSRASLLAEWKLTAKAELNHEMYKSWRKYWKNQVSSCHRSSPVSRTAWTLPWKLHEPKKYPRKTWAVVNLEAMWFDFWMNWKERKWRWRFLSSVVSDSQISLI